LAVYGKTYKAYAGPLTSHSTRLAVIPRYALRELFQSKLFLVFLVLCAVPPLMMCIWVYLAHNAEAIEILKLPADFVQKLLGVGPSFFGKWVMIPLQFVAFFMALVVGPALVAPDLRNNAMPLYLARPITPWDYVLGKLAVLVLLLSAVTWVPGLLVFGFKSVLGGGTWFADNFWVAGSIVLGSLLWIVTLALVALAISASVKWKPVARLLFFAGPMLAEAMGGIINIAFRTHWGKLLSTDSLLTALRVGLFDLPQTRGSLPSLAPWLVFPAICLLSLLVLRRRVRAYEVES
jgi:ABC-2 type transport system permease protein